MRILVAALAALVTCGSTYAQSMFRGNAGHTGVVDAQAPRQFHRIKWTFPTGDRIVSSPVYRDGTLYFGGDDGYVYAVGAIDGRQRWKHKTGGPVASTPAIAGDLLYVVSYDGKLYALDVRSGVPRWIFRTQGERRFEAKGLHGFQPRNQTIADPYDVFLSSPVVADEAVFFGSGDGNVYALDARSGALRWTFRTGDVVHASPAYADGVLFFGSWDSYFYAVDVRTGMEKWRFHGGEDPLAHNQVGFQSSPAVVNGVVYVGCRDSNLYAIDATTGKERWRFNNSGSWVITSPAVTSDKVVFATSDSSLYFVLDAHSAAPLVRQQGKAYMFASPVIAGDVVLSGVLNGTLEARDLRSGEVLWTFATEASKRNEGWVLTADRRFNGSLLFASTWREAPMVAAQRQFSVGSIFSTPLVVDGVVFFGSTDGNLYAVE
ncbi:MAG TPA: PQQ-binding-like beta-propeller repeat protein [Casimicrobiaceae bacterium]|nr:PQQ-binding-like beta-propeller repeat protein [Casimicrobiaceae bacterium]